MRLTKGNFLLTLFSAIILCAILSCVKKDGEPPYIDMKGSSEVSVQLNAPYADAGATARDNFDDDVPVFTENQVNTLRVGTYYVIYTAQDQAGNVGTDQRTVYVGNRADVVAGTYYVTKDCGYGATTHIEAITSSQSLNNRLTFSNFFDYNTFNVDVDYKLDSTLTFASQIVKADANGDTIIISNTNEYGQSKVLSDGRLVVQITEFVKSDTGSIRGVPGTKYTLNCTCMYTKQ